MPRTKTPRDLTKYRLLPSLDPETYAGLKANIALNGVQVPVVKDEDGYILDGFARAKIAEELGYECPSLTVKGLTEQEKRSQVRALNRMAVPEPVSLCFYVTYAEKQTNNLGVSLKVVT